MPSITLPESAKLAQDEFVSGVIESIITVNEMYRYMPFDAIDGNALAYNRENVLGDVQFLGVGDTITAKSQATVTQVTSTLTTLIGDAEVNNLIQATRSSDGNDQTAIQIASKAKNLGRQYQDRIINGTGTNDEFPGLIQLTPSSQMADTGANGAPLSFSMLDELVELVTAKDGIVDFFMMHSRVIRRYKQLLRQLGGASINEVIELPGGYRIPVYNGIPIFRNDYIPTNQVKGSSSNRSTIWAGCFDDGSRKLGIAGLTARNDSGISLTDVGEKEDKDEHIWRVKWYCGFALFSERALAAADGVSYELDPE